MVMGNIYVRRIFQNSVIDKEMRCYKFHNCAEILWLNCCALGLKIYQSKKLASLVSFNFACQARNSSSEI